MNKPYFELSKKKILSQYKLAEGIANIVSYSSKTNPDVTPILERETNCMFSVHLKNELKHIKDKSRVLFIAQGLNDTLLDELTGDGIRSFVVDNESDLDALLRWLEKSGTTISANARHLPLEGRAVRGLVGGNGSAPFKINLMLRVKLKEYSIRTEKYFVFGMSAAIVNKRIKGLKGHPNIASLGIHFHRKTQNLSEWNYEYELSNMFDAETFDIIDTLNIGGGLPSTYANTNAEVIGSVLKKINELRSFLNSKRIKIMIEPGRFIAAPAGKLVANIIAIYDGNIIVDASVYNSDMDALIVPVKLLVEGEVSEKEGRPYVIKGVTPCSMDLFRYKVYLDSPKVGDKIVFLNAGAYNFRTDFCDLEKIETRVVE